MYSTLKSYKIELPTVVLCYRLLKSANLPKDRRDLARATISELTYEAMKKQIKAIYDHCSSTSEIFDESNSNPEEENNVLYAGGNNSWRNNSNRNSNNNRYNNNNNYRGGRGGRGGFGQHGAGRGNGWQRSGGSGRQCNFCGRFGHHENECRDKERVVESIQYLTNGSDTECFLAQEASESLNCAVVDSGCGKNVCGQNWLKCFKDTLPPGVDLVESEPSKEGFRFGEPTSPLWMSSKRVTIPARFGSANRDIVTDVIECDVPMLLSTPFMKHAESSLDFCNDEITMFGETIRLQHTSSGHYCIPIIFEQPNAVMLTNEEI